MSKLKEEAVVLTGANKELTEAKASLKTRVDDVTRASKALASEIDGLRADLAECVDTKASLKAC